ncbi:hypothetical protein ANCDUO_19575 [Ancylostoma duodenale]|uniref:RRM domain-containing protein n=1 Tax=Ancylostoma duodenale TaxID=51022 RepID=A0A0C2CKR9_9BILA|nr:hypothetical protein ANCDUO_19575 [Ancylostoma duodenale]
MARRLTTKKEDLQNVCSKFGTFTDIVLPPSKKMPGRIAGFAFVQFKTREAAEKAREHFNSNKFQQLRIGYPVIRSCIDMQFQFWKYEFA